MPWSLPVLLILMGILAAACSFDPAMGPLACSEDLDCSPGCRCLAEMVCVPATEDAVCQPICQEGARCALPHAQGRCVGGGCTVEACEGDWADCNELAVDGCEVDLSANDLNCAQCGKICPGGFWCQAKVCVPCADDAHCGPACRDCAARPQNTACLDGSCGCMTEVDCALGQTCQEGRCQDCLVDCTDRCGGAGDGCGGVCDAPCPAGSWCEQTQCLPCNEPTRCGPECTDCSQQANNLSCAGDRCGCTSASDCSPGETCDPGSHLCSGCTPDCSGRCDGAEDGCGGLCAAACPAGARCVEGICAACELDTACGPSCEDCSLAATDGTTCALVDGSWACRCTSDLDCASGSYCPVIDDQLGDCRPCVEDDHCGPLCLACGAAATGSACLDGQNCGCYSSGDCKSDQVCKAGACVTSQQADGGLDDADGDDGLDAFDADGGPDADDGDAGLDGSIADLDLQDGGEFDGDQSLLDGASDPDDAGTIPDDDTAID